MENKKLITILVFVVCYSVILCRLLFVPASIRSYTFGDGFSDLNTLSSAHYFYDFGFTKTKLLPVHNYPPIEKSGVYTHYPAIPNILAGVYAICFNSTDERILRIIPTLLSFVFFFLIFYILKKVTLKDNDAFIAGCILVLSGFFIAFADNLHKHLYEELINWLFFLLLYQYHENERKSKLIFSLLLILILIGVNISFEQPVFLGTLVIGFSIVYQKKFITKETICCFIALLVGFGFHLLQNTLYFGSIDIMLKDMKETFLFRNAGITNGAFVPGKPFSLSKNFWEIPITWFNRTERLFLFPGWGLLLMSFWGLKQLFQTDRKRFSLIIITFCAGASWSIVMPQHAYIHLFTVKHFSIFYGLVLVYALPSYIIKLRTDFKGNNLLYKVFHILLVGYFLGMLITQQIWDLYIKNGFLNIGVK
jgi:hypothetical protein